MSNISAWFHVVYPLPDSWNSEITFDCEGFDGEAAGINVGDKVHFLKGRARTFYGNPQLELEECQFTVR